MHTERNSSSESLPQPESLRRNFNDTVLVRITTEGERILNEFYEKLGIKAPPIERDEDGWTRMQLYEVAFHFGPKMYMGNCKLPIEPTFMFESS